VEPAVDSDGIGIDWLTSWDISALAAAGYPVDGWPTRRTFDLDVEESAGVATVTLSVYGQAVASGSVTYPGTATLAEANGSGVSGTVVVGAAAADLADGVLTVRFPAEVEILRGTSDPPTVEVASVAFSGADAAIWTEPADLAAATYYYRVRYVSDTGETGTASASLTAAIPGPPAPPTSLAYASGTAAATVLSFVKSTTPGATYRAYLQEPDQNYMAMNIIAATAPADSVSITLPAISGYAGWARVVLRAVLAGVEEQVGAALEIEYDAGGARVAARPGPCTLALSGVAAGGVASFDGAYDPDGGVGVAATLKLFSRLAGGSYDYGSPVDSAALTVGASGIATATLDHTSAGADVRYYVARAATVAGLLSETDSNEVTVRRDDTAPAAPAAAAVSVSRG
jgi:hypothetical protein